MSSTTPGKAITVDATVSSKGQVTLPRELRKRLGLQRGSRVRFSIPGSGAVLLGPVLYNLEDLWRMADEVGRAGDVMTLEEMDEAKARRQW